MPVPADIATRFEFEAPYVARLAVIVRDVLFGLCEKEGFAYLGRIKALNSFWEKIETGRYPTWDSVDDRFACAIIVPRTVDEATALQFLESKFAKVDLKKRGATLKDPSVYRFEATRFYARLIPPSDPDARSEVHGIVFEVQIRTAFEHAWAVATHALSYKGDRVDWKRLRLASQLKASVEQLDSLVSAYENSAAEIVEHDWPETTAKREIEKFFRSAVDERRLLPESAPDSWVRFCDTLYRVVMSRHGRHARPDDISKVITEMLASLDESFREKDFVPPRSVTLLQLSLGVLTTRRYLIGPIARYTPPISRELATMYPDVSVLGAGFDF